MHACSEIRNSLFLFNLTSPRAHYSYPLYINYQDLELGPQRLITQSIKQSINQSNQQVIPRKIPHLLLPRQIPQGIF